MDPSTEQQAKLQVPVRFLAFVSIFFGICFYFFVRKEYAPAHITKGQQLFVAAYGLFLGFIFSLGMTRMFRESDRWPWGQSRGKRVLTYIVGALVLEGILFALRLPTFYDNVFQHTFFLILAPIFLGGQKWSAMQAWLEPAQTPTHVIGNKVDNTGRDLVLSMPLRKPVFLLFGSLAFVLFGLCTQRQSPMLAWTSILFFGLGIPTSLLMFIPGFRSLVLRRDGFTVRHVWRRLIFGWDEISDLTVVQSLQGPRVAWNTTQPGARRLALLREMYGRDLILPDNYGVSAQDLCAMMIERREAVLGRPT